MKSKDKIPWQSMESAPLTGKAIRLLLKDGFGTYPFEPVKWDKKKQKWVNALSYVPIATVAVGWSQMKGINYGQKTKDRADSIG